MNADELRRGLDALAERAPDGEDLLDRVAVGRWLGRPEASARSRKAAPLLAAAACAALVAGVAFVPSIFDRSRDEQTSSPRRDDAGGANAGMGHLTAVSTRQVGRGRVVVSVPVTWSSVQPQCSEPVVDGYFFTVGFFRACSAHRPPGITTLQIDSIAATGRNPDDPGERTHDLGGHPYGVARSSQAGYETAVVVVPDEDVRLTVRGPGASVETIVASLALLPEGAVAIPQLSIGIDDGEAGNDALPTLAELRRRLERVGLAMEIDRGGSSPEDYARLKVTPRPGTVVDVGSTVLVELVGTRGIP
ncbi:PASTA domain-containing protein [Mumia qirimensis]|uniref:PASTA domain-containing protein n=1 Tax=Mumia qirimensis TaxID=3234852 RepID=UPI00351CBB80